ncbi:hypothetical protein OAF68_01605 [Akkermansiaceae bacterium]|nr:hypothetical protein [Akkermansiaceae bacterium]
MKFNHQTLASILAFFIGYELLLPTSSEGLIWYRGNSYTPPYLITRMEIINGFFLKDLISIFYLVISSRKYFFFQYNTILKKTVFIYLSTALYGVFIASLTGHVYDVFENIRLIIIAATLVCFYNSNRNKSLLGFAIGLIVSGILNLYVSYSLDLYGFKPLFFLVNQNGPGPIAALLLHLTKNYRRNSRVYTLLKVVLMAIATLCLSKIAYLIMLLYFIRAISNSRMKIRRLIVILSLVFAGLSSSLFLTIYWTKFDGNISIIEKEGGDQVRLAYYRSQIGILGENPLGNSYSGFYDAIEGTADYRRGIINEEDSIRANPHSTLLYYMSSHGIFGIFIIGYLGWMFLFSDYRTKNIYTNLSIVIYLLTIPYFLVTYFFVLPFILINKR